MRKYIKPELDIVKFDGVDVITMSGGSDDSGSDPTVTSDSTETISPSPTGEQNPTENPLANPAEVHSSETDNTADIPASDDASGDVVPSGDGDASGDSAPSEDAPADAADTPVDEQPVESAAEAAPQADAEVVTDDMTTVE